MFLPQFFLSMFLCCGGRGCSREGEGGYARARDTRGEEKKKGKGGKARRKEAEQRQRKLWIFIPLRLSIKLVFKIEVIAYLFLFLRYSISAFLSSAECRHHCSQYGCSFDLFIGGCWLLKPLEGQSKPVWRQVLFSAGVWLKGSSIAYTGYCWFALLLMYLQKLGFEHVPICTQIISVMCDEMLGYIAVRFFSLCTPF